jgi:hypothetical protein
VNDGPWTVTIPDPPPVAIEGVWSAHVVDHPEGGRALVLISLLPPREQMLEEPEIVIERYVLLGATLATQMSKVLEGK